MSDSLIDGVIRKLWIDRAGPYRDPLLRLDAESRRNRFGGAVSDEFIHKYIALPIGLDAVIHGYFVDGVLRGVAELRPLGPGLTDEAEAAFSMFMVSIEEPIREARGGELALAQANLRAIESIGTASAPATPCCRAPSSCGRRTCGCGSTSPARRS